MKVCFILEGCYPYVFGGVATWVNNYILSKPDVEFSILTIGAKKKDRCKFVYDIPKNVTKIYENFLDEDISKKVKQNIKTCKSIKKYKKDFMREMYNLIVGNEINWDIIFEQVRANNWNVEEFFDSKQYLEIIKYIAENDFCNDSFSEIFFGMKSMLIPILQLLNVEIPEADIYHSAATGYAGIIGSMIRYKTNKPFILTEHGIYPREREEEILAANWLNESQKKIWIKFFYNISKAAYKYASTVTCLFEGAKDIQKRIGCPPEKLNVVANGIQIEKYENMELKKEDGYIDIGAFVRFSNIKDIKTLLYSFYEVESELNNVRLHIFGATNDKSYHKECLDIINNFNIRNITIYGQVNPMEYMPKMDFTILTSISEGQPLTILESFAARRPVVCTNVGCCKELIEGIDDGIGNAGFCCSPMDIKEISDSMKILAKDSNLRRKMGENGLKRAKNSYQYDVMMNKYFNIYAKELK